MFHAKRWAQAFVAAACETGAASSAGAACETGAGRAALETLKSIRLGIKGIPDFVSGSAAAEELGALVRRAFAGAGLDRENGGPEETALRSLMLLIRKGFYKELDVFIREAERILDARDGIIEVNVETASPLESDFEEELKAALRKKSGAKGIKLSMRVTPELMAGCRLRMGGISMDASLKGRLRNLERDLCAGSLAAETGPGGFS